MLMLGRCWWWLGLGLACVAPQAVLAQCVTKPLSCVEFVTVGRGPAVIRVYRTHDLSTPNDSITRALVVIHGADRAARFEFRSVQAAAFLAGALDNTVVVAPRFSTNDGSACKDSLVANELNFNCDVQRVDWRMGGNAVNDTTLSAFDAVDAILLKLANKSVFPNLKSIVVAGHSAGGQFVTLYQMVNQVHERLGVETSYVVANASAYPYLDDRRPITAAPAASGGTTEANERITFSSFASAPCPAFSTWPYGLAHRVPYAARLSEAQLKEQASHRPVTYLLGQLDVVPPGGFFGSCAGMAQGNNRQVRGQAFAQYMTSLGGASHKAIIVDGCGHEARCIYTSEEALPVLFPRR